ncbi:MAG: hypothetical protein D6734_11670 [Candidatus Schekmanbacteria bacterium]|nr:MAG: hypothetical protein D6734_11670 [Candidatus Schekmanbacteria bacterium]
MEFKQDTIEDIVESEKQMVLHGVERFGNYFINAKEFNTLLQQFVKSVNPDRFIFVMFLAQIHKHHLLALFSSVRLHHIQAMMNLRQVLEAGSCAAYAIANPNPAGFADIDEHGIINPTKRLAKKRYDWLEANFKKGSDAIKRMKDQINKAAAHSNIVTAHNNFRFDSRRGKPITTFFDIEDDYLVKTDLWQIGNIAMGLMDLFYGANKDLNVIQFADDFIPRLKTLEIKNQRLKEEIIQSERYKKAQKYEK